MIKVQLWNNNYGLPLKRFMSNVPDILNIHKNHAIKTSIIMAALLKNTQDPAVIFYLKANVLSLWSFHYSDNVTELPFRCHSIKFSLKVKRFGVFCNHLILSLALSWCLYCHNHMNDRPVLRQNMELKILVNFKYK